MGRLSLAIVGFGNLGRACARAILKDEQIDLAGIVRRAEYISEALPTALKKIPIVSHISELPHVDGALICVPTELVFGVAHDLLQHGIPIVECATLHGNAFQDHKREIDRIANNHHVTAIVGAGWDPGVLSLFRDLFALVTPKGYTEISRRSATSLHHTTVASAVPGVKEALATEQPTSDGKVQRYVYVQLEPGADFDKVESAILSDPLFLAEETLVFPVDDIAMLEDEGNGVLLERKGEAAGLAHQLFLLEGRYSESALAAETMVAAAKALPMRSKRAYGLFDLPLGMLWGERRTWAELEWL